MHDGREQTLRCLRSLAAGTVVPRVVIVDDGSTDGTAAAVAPEFPDAVVLQGGGNLWWTGAINLGVRHALATGADAVLFMNNDNVVDSRAIEALVACVTECPSTVVASKLLTLSRPDEIVCAGGVLDWARKGPACLGSRERDGGQFEGRRDVAWLSGSSVLIPRACFDAVGLLDERAFPQWWSDGDFTLRASAAGWRLICDGSSRVWNDVSTTAVGVSGPTTLRTAWFLLTSNKSAYRLRPAVRFFARHGPGVRTLGAFARYYRPLVGSVRMRYRPRADRRRPLARSEDDRP